MHRVIAALRRALVKLLPPGNRPGHENTPAFRGGTKALDGEAAAAGRSAAGDGAHGRGDA